MEYRDGDVCWSCGEDRLGLFSEGEGVIVHIPFNAFRDIINQNELNRLHEGSWYFESADRLFLPVELV